MSKEYPNKLVVIGKYYITIQRHHDPKYWRAYRKSKVSMFSKKRLSNLLNDHKRYSIQISSDLSAFDAVPYKRLDT